VGVPRTLPTQHFQGEASMKFVPLILASLVGLAIAGARPANAGDTPAAGDPSTNHVFEIPQSTGNGEGQEVSVLLDAAHLKLATVVLRRGSVLPYPPSAGSSHHSGAGRRGRHPPSKGGRAGFSRNPGGSRHERRATCRAQAGQRRDPSRPLPAGRRRWAGSL